LCAGVLFGTGNLVAVVLLFCVVDEGLEEPENRNDGAGIYTLGVDMDRGLA
jgi:hypothetical protein